MIIGSKDNTKELLGSTFVLPTYVQHALLGMLHATYVHYLIVIVELILISSIIYQYFDMPAAPADERID